MNRSEQFYFLMYRITLLLVFSGTNVASSSNAGLFSETSESDSMGQPAGNYFDEDFSQFRRIRYNNRGLPVGVGVGLWAVPFPVDCDEDGRNELLVGCGGRPYNGIFLFDGGDSKK